jgi:hypothetical protein
MKHFLQREHSAVWRDTRRIHKKASHLALPASVNLLLGHEAAGALEVFGFEIADQQAVGAEKERVVAPAGFSQRLLHVFPDGTMAALIFFNAVGPDL